LLGSIPLEGPSILFSVDVIHSGQGHEFHQWGEFPLSEGIPIAGRVSYPFLQKATRSPIRFRRAPWKGRINSYEGAAGQI